VCASRDVVGPLPSGQGQRAASRRVGARCLQVKNSFVLNTILNAYSLIPAALRIEHDPPVPCAILGGFLANTARHVGDGRHIGPFPSRHGRPPAPPRDWRCEPCHHVDVAAASRLFLPKPTRTSTGMTYPRPLVASRICDYASPPRLCITPRAVADLSAGAAPDADGRAPDRLRRAPVRWVVCWLANRTEATVACQHARPSRPRPLPSNRGARLESARGVSIGTTPRKPDSRTWRMDSLARPEIEAAAMASEKRQHCSASPAADHTATTGCPPCHQQPGWSAASAMPAPAVTPQSQADSSNSSCRRRHPPHD